MVSELGSKPSLLPLGQLKATAGLWLEAGVQTRALTCKDGTLNQLHQFIHLCEEVHGDFQVPTGWAVKESLPIEVSLPKEGQRVDPRAWAQNSMCPSLRPSF